MTIERGESMTSQSPMKKDRREYQSGGKYEGEWRVSASEVCVCRQGKGTLELPDKSVYRGQFEGGLFQGHGLMDIRAAPINGGSTAVHHYEGQFWEGRFHGYGVFTFNDGSKFEGEFEAGKMYGLGRLTLSAADAKRTSRPPCEGRFENGRLVSPQTCQSTVEHALKAAAEAKTIAATIK